MRRHFLAAAFLVIVLLFASLAAADDPLPSWN
jgi:hypothetical protein